MTLQERWDFIMISHKFLEFNTTKLIDKSKANLLIDVFNDQDSKQYQFLSNLCSLKQCNWGKCKRKDKKLRRCNAKVYFIAQNCVKSEIGFLVSINIVANKKSKVNCKRLAFGFLNFRLHLIKVNFCFCSWLAVT